MSFAFPIMMSFSVFTQIISIAADILIIICAIKYLKKH